MTKLRWEWTVPNILSLFRIALIPVLVITYLSCNNIWIPASVLVLSGLTDLFDGWIARHFHQISEVGKLLDPLADKLTQFTVVVCLATTYPSLWWLVAIVAIKEILQGIGGLLLLNKDVKVVGAKWFGKVSTALFYVVMVALVLFPSMDDVLRWSLIGLVGIFMIGTFLGYLRTYFTIRKNAGESDAP